MKNPIVWLTVNRNCNLDCTWCYQGQFLGSGEQMSLLMAQQLINLSMGVGARKIILLGGEPTIHPEILNIIEYCRSLETSLLTNGIAFANKNFCRRVEQAGLSIVSTSLKGASEKDYSASCGKGMFSKVMQGIENLEKSQMRHQVSITVSRPVIENWPEILRVIRECGAKDFTFSFERPVVVKEGVSMDDRMLPGNIIRFIEKEMYPSLKETGVGFDLNITFPQCHFSEGFVGMVHAEGHAVAGCQLLMKSGMIFDPSGQVLSCNHMVDHPIGRYGKDFKTVEEMLVWRNSPGIKRFYDVVSAPPGAQCRNCDKWSSCGAGCRIFWLYKGTETLIPVNSIKRYRRDSHEFHA